MAAINVQRIIWRTWVLSTNGTCLQQIVLAIRKSANRSTEPQLRTCRPAKGLLATTVYVGTRTLVGLIES